MDWLVDGPLVEESKLLKQVHLFIYIVNQPWCNAEASHFAHIRDNVKDLTVERYDGNDIFLDVDSQYLIRYDT